MELQLTELIFCLLCMEKWNKDDQEGVPKGDNQLQIFS